MKTVKEWQKEIVVFHLAQNELIKLVQRDAYNSALTKVKESVKLVSKKVDGGAGGHIEGYSFQTYSPSKGMVVISVSEHTIMDLLMPEK